eukprot:IDg20478t1
MRQSWLQALFRSVASQAALTRLQSLSPELGGECSH